MENVFEINSEVKKENGTLKEKTSGGKLQSVINSLTKEGREYIVEVKITEKKSSNGKESI
jgi:hypothetical protein